MFGSIRVGAVRHGGRASILTDDRPCAGSSPLTVGAASAGGETCVAGGRVLGGAGGGELLGLGPVNCLNAACTGRHSDDFSLVAGSMLGCDGFACVEFAVDFAASGV